MLTKKRLPQNLLSTKQLTQQHIENIFQIAEDFLKHGLFSNKEYTALKGHVVTHLFFEPSTRTLHSFEIAAKRLGAITITPHLPSSSLVKGETLLDTIHTFQAMGTHQFIIRHSKNRIVEECAKHFPNSVFINAGDGNNQHPTQSLIDLFTISQHQANWPQNRISIIGDILHSRVANSLIHGLISLDVAAINLIGPQVLLPSKKLHPKITQFTDLKSGIKDSNIIYCLRIQKERLAKHITLDDKEYHRCYGLTPTVLRHAKPGAIIMHPGPINRGIEVNSEIVDSKQSVIAEQVKNSVAIRMAILNLFSKNYKD